MTHGQDARATVKKGCRMFDLSHIITLLPAFAVVLTRVSGLMLAAPLFSLSVIPPQVKAGLAALISLIIFPVVRPTMGQLPENLLGVVIACGGLSRRKGTV